MKTLNNRQEITTAINFHKYPIVKIDLAEKDSYGVKGTKVNIDFGKDYYLHATIRMYDDEPSKFYVKQNGSMVSATCGYSDYMEMVEFANAPIIKANQEILLIIVDSSKKTMIPVVVNTSEKVYPHCQNPLEIIL